MIDRSRRDQFAEYEAHADQVFKGIRPSGQGDLVLWAVYDQVWFLYDDLRTHRMTGKWALSSEARTEIARWIMFLYTDQEYEWPIARFISFSSCLMNLMTLGLWGWIMEPRRKQEMEAFKAASALQDRTMMLLSETGCLKGCNGSQ